LSIGNRRHVNLEGCGDFCVKSLPIALHSELSHTDPAGRNDSTRLHGERSKKCAA